MLWSYARLGARRFEARAWYGPLVKGWRLPLEPLVKFFGPLIITWIELYGDHDQFRWAGRFFAGKLLHVSMSHRRCSIFTLCLAAGPRLAAGSPTFFRRKGRARSTVGGTICQLPRRLSMQDAHLPGQVLRDDAHEQLAACKRVPGLSDGGRAGLGRHGDAPAPGPPTGDNLELASAIRFMARGYRHSPAADQLLAVCWKETGAKPALETQLGVYTDAPRPEIRLGRQSKAQGAAAVQLQLLPLDA